MEKRATLRIDRPIGQLQDYSFSFSFSAQTRRPSGGVHDLVGVTRAPARDYQLHGIRGKSSTAPIRRI